MNIGVIPARAGSKRFPGKNRAKLAGIPLWKRACGLAFKFMDRTIVNTDDPEILKDTLFEKYVRPEHLRDGVCRIDDVLIEMVETLKFKSDDVVYLFQPTSPLTDPATVLAAITSMEDWPEADSVQSVYRVSNTFHSYSQRIFIDGWVNFAFPELRMEHFNSQKKPDHYVFAGFVGCRVKAFLKNKNIWGTKSLGIIAGPNELMDIDTEEDLKNVEFILAA